ncbi:uncharacterized protein LOC112563288 isoform X2 [Pomacea canaliculata]|nr:uncharacterized protein LOC112563288 isoform X2 [Pomacea canaliculata]
MASLSQRHLLSLVEAETEALDGIGAIVTASVLTLVLVLVLLMCTCDQGSEAETTELQSVSHRNSAGPKTLVATDLAGDIEALVDGEAGQTVVAGERALNNGVSANRNSMGSNSHSRQASSGSLQMRPTSLRELPEVPTSNHSRNHSGSGGLEKQAGGLRSSHEGDEDDVGYDHLCARVGSSNKPAKNYDHIKLDSPGQVSISATPVSDPDNISENHYSQVRERTYDVVKDVRARGATNSMASHDFDPYAKVKDDDDDKEDPYAKVRDGEKDTDDYSHLKHKHLVHAVPSVKAAKGVVEDDEEDPYERVIGDSGSARVQVPLSVADLDDPYSTVMDQPAVTVIPMHVSTTTVTNSSAGGAVNSIKHKSSSVHASHGLPRSDSNHFHLKYADEDSEVQGDYAVVMKDRQGSVYRRQNNEQRGDDGEEDIMPYFSSPPEPPRLYGTGETLEEDDAMAATPGSPSGGSRRAETKEHKYTKVTARESLASMTARNALNMYEIVPDLAENTYATVEGGSGDGVVHYASASMTQVYPHRHDADPLNETYAEINTSTSGTYTPTVPEPPSLDTLHFMTKSTTSSEGDHSYRNPSSPSATNAGVFMMDDGYAAVSKTSSFSPSETALPLIPRSATTGSVHNPSELTNDASANGISMHPDYHRVKDYIGVQDMENDPNYESVDEAYARTSSSMAALGSNSATASKIVASPSRRQHEYEEVSPSGTPLSGGRKSNGQTSALSKGKTQNSSISTDTVETIIPSVHSHQSIQTAAYARDRVLEGHMYEDINEVQKRKRSLASKSAGGTKVNKEAESTH